MSETLEQIALRVAKEINPNLLRFDLEATYEFARRLVATLGAQEPVAWLFDEDGDKYWYESVQPFGQAVYAAPVVPADWQMVPKEPIKTGDPEISREHLVAIAEKCGLLGAYRTREVVDAIVGYGQVILRDKAVQEAMHRAMLAADAGVQAMKTQGICLHGVNRTVDHCQRCEDLKCIADLEAQVAALTKG